MIGMCVCAGGGQTKRQGVIERDKVWILEYTARSRIKYKEEQCCLVNEVHKSEQVNFSKLPQVA